LISKVILEAYDLGSKYGTIRKYIITYLNAASLIAKTRKHK
jgi:hypothetical protein